MDDRISKAIEFAVQMHGNQKYGPHKYIVHLENVAQIVKVFSQWDQDLIVAAYLHDVIEDTPASYSDIYKLFGLRVAELVFAVTDELGRNRKERHEKTYPKIASNNDAITLKLADRISNVAYSVADRERNRLRMYLGEHKDFKTFFYGHKEHERMWEYLEKLFEQGVELGLDKK